MNSQTSRSNSFELLHPVIKKWVWQQKWCSLREVQERAIPYLINPNNDLIISASTAGGKTEAAFLPIISYILDNPKSLVLYVSPLKALINDQYTRLSGICDPLEIQVIPWHGDISQGKKQGLWKDPTGIVIITPESLEALFVNKGSFIPSIFKNLKYIVIDEMHAFIGTERGKQLQSLMHRIDFVLKHKTPRIGLSATLGDMSLASDYLRPDKSSNPDIIQTGDKGKKLKVLLSAIQPTTSEQDDAIEQIGKILFDKLYDSDNLVFPNSRKKVEQLSSYLADMCEEHNLPNHFFPHHGSLSAVIREDAEAKVKSKTSHATIIATTTLELGIDIGSVKSIVQVGSPPSVASLKQRLGRSGRTVNEPSILRSFSKEPKDEDRADLSEYIAQNTLENIAMIELMIDGWVEPPNPNYMHLSTLIQQILSTLSQFGGASIASLWTILVEKGAFNYVKKDDFVEILKSLNENELIFQDGAKTVHLAPKGESVMNHYTFYTAFITEKEFKIVHNGTVIGSIPSDKPLAEGSFIIFAGRKWVITRVELENLIIVVNPAQGGKVPDFDGSGCALGGAIRQKMKEVLFSTRDIPYLDQNASRILNDARKYASESGLDKNTMISNGNTHLIVGWQGDRINNTLTMILSSMSIEALNCGCYIEIRTKQDVLMYALAQISKMPESEFKNITSNIKNFDVEKWDRLVPQNLKHKSYCDTYLDFGGTKQWLKSWL